uniref:Uncharacterized protein n=1 Tax=Panagrolaimus superbus TaxID=310955 RepID=A0A914Z829_9BILA
MANLKPVYKFEEISLEEEEQSIGCKCCAICGKATDERAFKNLMIMDFSICFETDEPSCDHSIKSLAFPCFKKGRWKTMVKSRLCQNCKKEFLEANDKTFEKYQKYQKKSQKLSNKRKIDATIESNKEQPQIASSSTKKTFYEKELEFYHDDAIIDNHIIQNDITDVNFPKKMLTENETERNQEDMNYSMDFINYSIPNEQTTFPSTSTSTCNFYPTQSYETVPIAMSQNLINFTDNFNNPDNISQSFYQNVHQQSDTHFQQPQHQCQYFMPTPMPIPPSETNTLQNSYIENIVLLDNQGNYVTTLQNNGDIFPESTGYDPRILNPENY